MSKDYKITWPGHPNVYSNMMEREITFYFSEPDMGVNMDTGLLLLIPGFGANTQSKVYKKMRSVFADQYNLVTVQCDYFGHEFMQESKSIRFNISKDDLIGLFTPDEVDLVFKNEFNANTFLQVGSAYNLHVSSYEMLNETNENFNDMGIMQAIDNLTALNYVMKILEDNHLQFEKNKLIVYGHSHGAFISYLCNALAPNLFSLLIDNSSWVFPVYLRDSRLLQLQIGKLRLQTNFDYLASSLDYDEMFLNLPTLYKLFENKCNILCYHGTTDELAPFEEKRVFCENVPLCTLHKVGQKEVDRKIFNSTNHGLGADFLELFSHAMANSSFRENKEIFTNSVNIETGKYKYDICYDTGLPVVTVVKK